MKRKFSRVIFSVFKTISAFPIIVFLLYIFSVFVLITFVVLFYGLFFLKNELIYLLVLNLQSGRELTGI